MKINKKTFLLVGILLVIILCVFVLGKIYYAQKNNLPNELKNTNEVIEKRTYNSRTFRNSDGIYKTELFSRDAFFFDGKQYVELEQISNPKIDKKLIILNRKPKSNIFDFGTYKIYEGINASILNGNLILNDANGRIFVTVPRPFSTDSNGSKSIDNYLIDFKNQTLKLFVEVNRSWLDNAKYPVEIDPTVILENSTGIYDAVVAYGDRYNQEVLAVGSLGLEGVVSFIEFNTSSIPDSSNISGVILNLTVSYTLSGGVSTNITRLNNTQPSNQTRFPMNSSGDQALWNAIKDGDGVGRGYYLIQLNMKSDGTEYQNDLGLNASLDLKNQLDRDFFAVGLSVGDISTEPFVPNATYFNSSETGVNFGPKLIVTYTLTCAPPNSGNWIINETCNIVGKNYTITQGNLTIQDVGFLNMSGSTNITFATANSYILIYRGGEINIYDKSGFNSAT